jgi:hypothetical protein
MRSKLKLLTLTVIVVLFIPNFLSTGYGTWVVSKLVSSLSGYHCYIQGRYRYFQPIEWDQIVIELPQGTFKSQHVVCTHSLSSIVTQKPLQISVKGFEFIWAHQTPPTIYQANLFPFPLFKLIPLHLMISLSQGELYSAAYEPLLKTIEGHLIYCHNNIDITLEAEADKGGFIKTSGQFHPSSESAAVKLTLHDCPKSVLPYTPLTQLLGPLINASLSFSGTYTLGHTTIDICTQGLRLQSCLMNEQKQLTLEGPTTLSLNQTAPCSLNGYEMTTLKGDLTILAGSIHLDDLTDIKNLEASATLSCEQLTTPTQTLGSIHVQGALSQQESDINFNLDLEQNRNKVLSIKTVFDQKQKKTAALTLQTFNLPLINLPPSLGTLASCQGDFLIDNKHLKGSLQGSSETVKEFNLQLDLSTDRCNIIKGSCRFESPHLEADVDLDTLNLPFNNLDQASGRVRIDLKKIETIDQTFLPIAIDSTIDSLKSVKTSVSSKHLNAQGIGLIDLKNRNVECLDLWKGSFCLPHELTHLNSTTTCCGHFELSGSFKKNFHLKATFDPIILSQNSNLSTQNLTLNATFDPHTLQSQAHLAVQFLENTQLQGSMEADLELQRSQVVKGSISFKNPPLTFLRGYKDLEKLEQLLGKNAHGQIKFDHKLQGYFCDVTLDSERINIYGSVLYTDTLQVLKPLKGEVKLSTLNLPFYEHTLPFKLKKQCTLKFTIDELTLPFKEITENWSLSADLKAAGVCLIQDQKTIQLDGFSLKLLKPSDQNYLKLEASGDLYSAYQKTLTTGSLNLDVAIHEFKGPWLDLDLSDSVILGTLKLDQCPTLFLDFFQPQANNPFTSTFGDTLQATITLEHQKNSGFLKCLATGKETLIKINASKQGDVYHLNDDLVIQTRLSKELSECLFRSKPLGIEKLWSNYPLVVRVAAQDSAFTLFPF